MLLAAITGGEAAGIGSVGGGIKIFSALGSLGGGFCGGGAAISFVEATTGAVVAAGVTSGRGVVATTGLISPHLDSAESMKLFRSSRSRAEQKLVVAELQRAQRTVPPRRQARQFHRVS